MPTPAQQESAMSPAPGRRLALVVGVNGPSIAGLNALRYATDDGRALAQVLQMPACGFSLFRDPLLGEQATTTKVRDAILDLADELRDDDTVLFYFSGHGEALPIDAGLDDVYLVTQDFNSTRVKRDKDAYLSMRWLRQKLFENEKAHTILLVLDCCYAGSFGETAPDLYLDELHQRLDDYFAPPSAKSPSRSGGIRLALTATGPRREAREKDGHSLLTGFLLSALRGEAFQAMTDEGDVTFHRLFDYLGKHMPAEQRPFHYGAGGQLLLASYPGHSAQARGEREQATRRAEREQRLQMMAAESGIPLRDRLDSFVVRAQELADLQQRIDALLPTGGYLTITGQAGQGKSTIIAQLIDMYGQKQGSLERIAYDFIPLMPAPGYQVPLLRRMMARLILKYDLPDLFDPPAVTENCALYCEAFSFVLKEVATKGGREVIFIDGLDQLAAERTEQRDLSFLPQGPGNPPAGIVFVLGTRHNVTLRPLKLLKRPYFYQLPGLRPEDFALILQRRGVTVEDALEAQLYEKLRGNALFLDLVAKQLARENLHSVEVEEIIHRIADDPEGLFSRIIEKLISTGTAWETVLKPLLGLLLAAREPLDRLQLKQLLNVQVRGLVDSEQLKRGLDRLSDLITADEQNRYALFHPKLYDFLRQEHVFDTEDEQGWHQRFISWCEQGAIADIWQENKDASEQAHRRYARQHYITHLYQAHDWNKLSTVLDKGDYGRAKLEHDSSMNSYALDLDRGRKAASPSTNLELQEAIHRLPHLWRYTLLQCSLASRADNYPVEAFELMLLLGEEAKVRGLAELMTVPQRKAEVLLVTANYIMAQHPERASEAERIQQEVARIERKQVSHSIAWQSRAFSKLGKDLTQEQRWREWQEAEALNRSITAIDERSEMYSEQAASLAQEQRWKEAEQACRLILNKRGQAMAFSALGKALALAQHWQEAKRIWREAEQACRLIPNKKGQVMAFSELGKAFVQVQHWQEAKRIWRETEQVSHSITNERLQALAFSDLGKALAQAQRWPEAERVSASIFDAEQQAKELSELEETFAQVQSWQEDEEMWKRAERVNASVVDEWWRAVTLSELGKAFAQAQQWSEAERIWREAERVGGFITNVEWQSMALSELGKVLAQAQQWSEAERVSAAIIDKRWRVAVLSELGKALAQAQRWPEAEEMWRRAEKVSASMTGTSWQAVALSDLGKAFAQAQQWEEAERVSAAITEKGWQAVALSDLGKALAQAQRWPEAERVSGLITDAGWQAVTFSELGKAFAQAQHWQKAEEMWHQAEQASRSITDPGWRVVVLSELGKALAQAQRWPDAERTWQDAERISRSIKDKWWQVEALSKLADTLASHHQDERAMHLVQSWWGQAKTRDEALTLLPLARGLILRYPELGIAFYDAFAWVNNFLRGEGANLRKSNATEKEDN